MYYRLSLFDPHINSDTPAEIVDVANYRDTFTRMCLDFDRYYKQKDTGTPGLSFFPLIEQQWVSKLHQELHRAPRLVEVGEVQVLVLWPRKEISSRLSNSTAKHRNHFWGLKMKYDDISASRAEKNSKPPNFSHGGYLKVSISQFYLASQLTSCQFLQRLSPVKTFFPDREGLFPILDAVWIAKQYVR